MYYSVHDAEAEAADATRQGLLLWEDGDERFCGFAARAIEIPAHERDKWGCVVIATSDEIPGLDVEALPSEIAEVVFDALPGLVGGGNS